MAHSVSDALAWSTDLAREAVDVFPSFLVAVGIFLLFVGLAFITSTMVVRHGKRCFSQSMVYGLIAKLVRVAIVVLGLLCALGTMGVSISALVTSFGLVGFAMGFALKDILASTLAGILLLLHRPFKIGDHLMVKGQEGQVVEIDLRFTVLHNEGRLVMIPNAVILKEVFVVRAACEVSGSI